MNERSADGKFSRIAIVAGASGLIGRALLELLLESVHYDRIIALVRKPLGLHSDKLTQHIVDYDNPELLPTDCFWQAAVFCALGTTIRKAGTRERFRRVDYEYPLKLASMAKLYGARQFLIVTAMGADSRSAFFYSRVKGDVETALQELALPSLHIFRPSLLLGNREEFRLGERLAAVLAKPLSLVMVGPMKKYRAIEASEVAKGMLAADVQGSPGVHIYESDEIVELSRRTM